MSAEISDRELRRMRDAVYPANGNPKHVQDDASWELVKRYWRKDVEWLQAEYEKVKHEQARR